MKEGKKQRGRKRNQAIVKVSDSYHAELAVREKKEEAERKKREERMQRTKALQENFQNIEEESKSIKQKLTEEQKEKEQLEAEIKEKSQGFFSSYFNSTKEKEPSKTDEESSTPASATTN